MTAPSPTARRLVRARTESQMTSQITILRGALGGLDPVTGDVGGLVGGTVVYQGKARIRTVSSGAISLGEGMVDTSSTIISIPITAAVPRRDDLVQVVSDGPAGDEADVDLDSHTFRVLDVDGGGYFGDARRLTCQGWHSSRYWGES